MGFFDYLPLLAGIGLFLYGMSIIGSSLEKLAGANLERTLGKLTNSKLLGVALGTVVTAVIQSSAATTVMAVGFLNAGILKLAQAIPVMMGAKIGTTVTAQILRLSDLDASESVVLTLIKPSTFAPILIVVGAFLYLTVKRAKVKNVAMLLIGLGCIFFGMFTMETTLAPLKEMESFRKIFLVFTNPILGILVGIFVTTLLQSSSASVGLLQAVASTGAIPFSAAFPIILGQNIGSSVTVLLASFGAGKNAKRGVIFHVLFNVVGTVIFLVGIYLLHYVFGLFAFWSDPIHTGGIANFHTLFNVLTTALLLPFIGAIIKLLKKVIPDGDEPSIEETLQVLDQRFINRPVLALEQAKKVLLSMGETAQANYNRAVKLLFHFDSHQMQVVNEYEDILDRSETALSNYMVQITSHNSLNHAESRKASEILSMLSDFERIGDYSVNIAEVADYNRQQNITFSPRAREELRYITDAVREIIATTVSICGTEDLANAVHVEPLEEVVDNVTEFLKSKHIDRLQKGKCTVQSGISFLELLTNLERISDHCVSVARFLLHDDRHAAGIDGRDEIEHNYLSPSEEYKGLYESYLEAYLSPLEQMEDLPTM